MSLIRNVFIYMPMMCLRGPVPHRGQPDFLMLPMPGLKGAEAGRGMA